MLAPVVPAQIIGIGLNYRKHAEETGAKLPEFPIVFFKNRAAVQNPGDAIEIPRKLASEQVDYECELAVVIGKTLLQELLEGQCAGSVSQMLLRGERCGAKAGLVAAERRRGAVVAAEIV